MHDSAVLAFHRGNRFCFTFFAFYILLSFSEFLASPLKGSCSRHLVFKLVTFAPNGQEEVGRFSDLKGYELCENVVYLGEHGCFTTREGMTIAYLSGRQQESGGGAKKDYEFGYDQVKSMEVRMKWGDTKFQGVDVLITSDWPHGKLYFPS